MKKNHYRRHLNPQIEYLYLVLTWCYENLIASLYQNKNSCDFGSYIWCYENPIDSLDQNKNSCDFGSYIWCYENLIDSLHQNKNSWDFSSYIMHLHSVL
jgi:hypothetical protein